MSGFRDKIQAARQPSQQQLMDALQGNGLSRVEVKPDGTLMYAGVTLSATGLKGLDRLNAEAMKALSDVLFRLDTSLGWWLGDLLVHSEHVWGVTVQQLAERYDRDEATLYDYKWVSANVSFRNEILSWSHHKAVAHLPQATQKAWLDLAQNEKWSSKRLRREIIEANRTTTLINPVQRFVQPETLKTLRRMSKLTPERIAKLKPEQIKEFRKIWDEATKEFGAVYVALLRRSEAIDEEVRNRR